jgi:hypothetical protein
MIHFAHLAALKLSACAFRVKKIKIVVMKPTTGIQILSFACLALTVSACGITSDTTPLNFKGAAGGALANRQNPTASPTATPTTPSGNPDQGLVPTYASIYTHIIKERCDGCHGKGSLLKRLPLSPYATLLASPKGLVTPKDPEHSLVVLAVERLDDDQMPPASKPPLNQFEKTTIREWVRNGALEN